MSVQVIGTLKPKNGLDFPVVEAVDVAVEGYSSLADAVTHFATDTAIAALTAALDGKADKTTTDDLQAQIDQIVISASAESVVAPEVAAARVDSDGNEYNTLRNRLDSHDDKAKATQNELRAAFDTISGAYVNKDTGAEGTSVGYFCTDFIPTSFDIAVRTTVAEDAAGICFYDKNKTYISGYNPHSSNRTEVILTFPANAAYVRISCANSYAKDFICRYDDVVSLISTKINEIGASAESNQEEIEELSSNVDDIEANIFGGIGTIQVSYTSGYYVNNVQKKLSPSAGFNYSEMIELKKGETLVVSGAKSNTTTVVDFLSHWTADGSTYIDSIEAYSSTDTTSTSYTATDEVEYVRICSNPIPTVKKTVSGLYTDINYISGEVKDLTENALSYQSEEFEATEVDGYFINDNGVIRAMNKYAYTESIELKRGDSITIESSDPSGSNVSRISLWTASGTYIRTVDYGTTARTTATYKATEEVEYIRLSYYKYSTVESQAVMKYNSIVVPPTFEAAVNGIIDERIPQTNAIDYSIAMFESVAFCGDSYVKGQIYNSQGLVGNRPALAWGSAMGRLYGVKSSIFASSGADTNTWQERSDCLPLALSESAKGLYIFCLGINDATYVTLGSINDITDYESYEDYPNTYYGNYGKIIEQIMAHAPNSKIIIMTPYHPSYNARYVTPISEITEHYGIAMIDTTQSELCMAATYTARMAGGHPTAALHSAIAKDAEKMISKCISDNYNYFKDYAGM